MNVKKVLILAYDFPPYVSVGGLRPYSWYKYFSDFGIYPVVITRQWDNKHGNGLDYISPSESDEIILENTECGTIIRTPYFPNFANRIMLTLGPDKFVLFRKLISLFYEVLQFFLPIGPKSQIYFAASDYLKNNKVDLIIATGDPFVLFKYAHLLSAKHNIPWIADYRDPWTQGIVKNPILRRLNAYLEKRYVESANSISTVSTFLQKKIATSFPEKKFHIIPNGYDLELVEQALAVQQPKSKLSIGFAGTIYYWHPIESFLQTCSEMVTEIEDIQLEINFYGITRADEIQKMVQESYPNLIPILSILPRMSNADLLKNVVQNHLFLLFNDYSYLGTKIFDYIGLKKPIILCYKNDSEAINLKSKFYKIEEMETESNQLQADLIEKTNSGIVVLDRQHLKVVLRDYYDKYLAEGDIKSTAKEVESLSRKFQVGNLANIIKEI